MRTRSTAGSGDRGRVRGRRNLRPGEQIGGGGMGAPYRCCSIHPQLSWYLHFSFAFTLKYLIGKIQYKFMCLSNKIFTLILKIKYSIWCKISEWVLFCSIDYFIIQEKQKPATLITLLKALATCFFQPHGSGTRYTMSSKISWRLTVLEWSVWSSALIYIMVNPL